MTEQQVPATAETIKETEINETENPATAKLHLGDVYMDNLYGNTFEGTKNLLANVILRNADGSESKLGDLLGMPNIEGITAFINNDVILPLINALGNMHATANTLMATTFQTVQQDMCLHKVSDIFLLQQSLLQLGVNTNVYYNRNMFDDKYPAEAGWSFNLLELNSLIVEAEAEAGIEYKDDEVPYRNEYVEIVDIKGNHMPNCRFVNFTYTNSVTNTQEVTDIPAFWNDDINEYVFIPYILKWRKANKLPVSLDDENFDASAISGGFLAQTTETHEQVHQQRVAARQAALEEAEEKRKADEAERAKAEEQIRDAANQVFVDTNFQEAVAAQKVAGDLLEQGERQLEGLTKPLSVETREVPYEAAVAATPATNETGSDSTTFTD